MTAGIARGKGQLFHHFHGNYWAQIVLEFESPEHAERVAVVLGAPWKQLQKDRRYVGCAVDGAALGVEKRKLGSFGADVKKIDSFAKSVDCGESFTIEVPLLPVGERPAGWGRDFSDESGKMEQGSLLGTVEKKR